jgi:hypothetical protein
MVRSFQLLILSLNILMKLRAGIFFIGQFRWQEFASQTRNQQPLVANEGQRSSIFARTGLNASQGFTSK